jgi:hypothetical protein
MSFAGLASRASVWIMFPGDGRGHDRAGDHGGLTAAADWIVVLDGGRIVEEGSHADLVGRGGHYAELYELQARGYR